MSEKLSLAKPDTRDPWMVAALYKFVALPDFDALREPILDAASKAGLVGTLLLAHEGINGTIAGPEGKMQGFLIWLRSLNHNNGKPFADLDHKESWSAEKPFLRLKVRLKKEIVTMGVENIDPNQSVGTYVEPEDWNELISDPDTIIVDTRNDYEVAIGTFEGAINPNTKSFREFPDWVDDNLPKEKQPKVAMFCTGGIRCEKSTALLKQKGFDNVFHLKGGILKYLETVPEDQSKWDGECFVFDSRVSVGHGLKQGDFTECFACRMPLAPDEVASEKYIQGISCPHCFDSITPKDRHRFKERQKQVNLAKQRGQQHLGQDAGKRG